MASTSGKNTNKKTSASGKRTQASGKGSAKNSNTSGNSSKKPHTAARNKDVHQAARDSELFQEIGLIILFVVMIILFLCNFGVIGPVGDAVSGVMFGLFGFASYIVPIVLFIAVAFWSANEGSPTAVRKMLAGTVLFLMIGVVCDLIAGSAAKLEYYDVKALYETSVTERDGGGCLAGSLSYLLQLYLETIGTILVVLLCSIISIILLTDKSLLKGVREGGSRIREDAAYRREAARVRREEAEERNRLRREELEYAGQEKLRTTEKQRRVEGRRQKEEAREDEKILRMNKKVTGILLSVTFIMIRGNIICLSDNFSAQVPQRVCPHRFAVVIPVRMQEKIPKNIKIFRDFIFIRFSAVKFPF